MLSPAYRYDVQSPQGLNGVPHARIPNTLCLDTGNADAILIVSLKARGRALP